MITRTIVLFGEATVGPDLVGNGRYLSTTTIEWIIILGAIVLVCGAVIGWAVYIRKPEKDRHHHHHHHRHSSSEGSGEGEANTGGHRRRKWRRRRREHRPRNPTLAETGGLPPIRAQGPPPPPP